MVKFFRFVSGFTMGMAAGVVAALLLAPTSGEELRLTVADSLSDVLEEGRLAAAETRATLQKQLAEASQLRPAS